MEQDHI